MADCTTEVGTSLPEVSPNSFPSSYSRAVAVNAPGNFAARFEEEAAVVALAGCDTDSSPGVSTGFLPQFLPWLTKRRVYGNRIVNRHVRKNLRPTMLDAISFRRGMSGVVSCGNTKKCSVGSSFAQTTRIFRHRWQPLLLPPGGISTLSQPQWRTQPGCTNELLPPRAVELLTTLSGITTLRTMPTAQSTSEQPKRPNNQRNTDGGARFLARLLVSSSCRENAIPSWSRLVWGQRYWQHLDLRWT